MKRKSQPNNEGGDIDDLDDLMGFGAGNEDHNVAKKND